MTETGLRERLDVWKRRLGLEHWLILLEIGGAEDDTSYMEVERSTVYQRAVIHVQPWLLGEGDAPKEVMIRGDQLTDRFVESSLVHELLHCSTRNMRAVVRDDLEGQVHRDVHTVLNDAMSRAEEQCVDALAEALVRAWS